MPNFFNRTAQLHYCQLTSILTSDVAERQHIILRRNVAPTLFFFIAIGLNREVQDWLINEQRSLKPARWLQLVGWLMDQDVFLVYQRSKMARFLMENGGLAERYSARSISLALSRPLPQDIEKGIKEAFCRYFCNGF